MQEYLAEAGLDGDSLQGPGINKIERPIEKNSGTNLLMTAKELCEYDYIIATLRLSDVEIGGYTWSEINSRVKTPWYADFVSSLNKRD